jgi:hypothetical protein
VDDRWRRDPARGDVPLRNQSGPNTLDFFQIWLNLPTADKMIEPYFTMLWLEDLPSRVLKDDADHSTEVTVVAGAFEDIRLLMIVAEGGGEWDARRIDLTADARFGPGWGTVLQEPPPPGRTSDNRRHHLVTQARGAVNDDP